MENQDGAVTASTPLSDRIKEAAEIIDLSADILTKSLEESGIDDTKKGLALLNSAIVTDRDLLEIIECIKESGIEKIPHLKKKAAVSILRGQDPFNLHGNNDCPSVDNSASLADSIAAGLKDALPDMKSDFKQLKDKDLLELYIQENDYEVEQELHRRAKHQPFVVLNDDKKVDLESSLDLLKRARRMVNPTMVPVGETIVPVYRITEVNPEDNIIEICPICGDILYKGYCGSCESNFAGIGNDERAYVHLIAQTPGFNARTVSDRRFILASAVKGIEDLKKTWPSMVRTYDDLNLTGSLPVLRKIRTLPNIVKQSDPFNIK